MTDNLTERERRLVAWLLDKAARLREQNAPNRYSVVGGLIEAVAADYSRLADFIVSGEPWKDQTDDR